MNPVEYLKTNPFVLAPMAGITDVAFRTFMREMGCGVVVTELVSSNGLQYASQRTRDLMRFEETQRPVGIQLFGEVPEHLANSAKYVQDQGADFVDLNFGCPVPKVVKNGGGAAILKDLNQLRHVLRTVKSAIQIPLTIKIRTGWDDANRNADQVAQIAYDEGITWVAIHGRTRTQAYAGRADWDYIASVKAGAKLPILGNGDIQTAGEANERLRTSGCDGVLIGRGCLKNPWIFRQAMELYTDAPERQQKETFQVVFGRLHGHLERYFDQRMVMLQLKKFAAWYSTGYPGAAHFRRQLFQSTTYEQILETIEVYFKALDLSLQSDTRNEPFLMGGHG
ncbi:MAG TPA: tRNA dihydrouridine synthase DusB [Bdellovibrionales bacterium]|nr:tRNA dihydrouridine synthase DusB [Bdellovibrionales bacterium]